MYGRGESRNTFWILTYLFQSLKENRKASCYINTTFTCKWYQDITQDQSSSACDSDLPPWVWSQELDSWGETGDIRSWQEGGGWTWRHLWCLSSRANRVTEIYDTVNIVTRPPPRTKQRISERPDQLRETNLRIVTDCSPPPSFCWSSYQSLDMMTDWNNNNNEALEEVASGDVENVSTGPSDKADRWSQDSPLSPLSSKTRHYNGMGLAGWEDN